MADLTRRGILGLAAGGLLAGASQGAEPKKGDKEKGGLPRFRFAMEKQKGRVTEGGSAKEATVKQLPISRGLAGVSMRLKPGGLRELHWHPNAAEWAFVVKGRVRTTVLGADGTAETNDFEPGDVWYFPAGHGHSLQGLGPEETHFVLIFDDGHFSEDATFSTTDWLGHTPPAILSKTLGLPEAALARLPREELYIVQGRVPPAKPLPLHAGGLKSPPLTHKYRLMAQAPTKRYPGGQDHLVTVKEFPIATTIAGALMELEPGAVREPHWHPTANEWLYLIAGKIRVAVFGAKGRAGVEEFEPGDAGYVPRGYGHAIENIGTTACRILIGFDKGEYQEVSLSTWLAANPTQLVADNFKMPDALAEQLPTRRVFIATRKGPHKDGRDKTNYRD